MEMVSGGEDEIISHGSDGPEDGWFAVTPEEAAALFGGQPLFILDTSLGFGGGGGGGSSNTGSTETDDDENLMQNPQDAIDFNDISGIAGVDTGVQLITADGVTYGVRIDADGSWALTGETDF